jgi:hypothetical protein
MESDYLAGYCATTKALADPFVHTNSPLGMYTPVCQLIWSQKKTLQTFQTLHTNKPFFWCFFLFAFYFSGENI